jgi:hypothetical protein
MTGLLILVITGLAAVAWWRLLKGKELARSAAGMVCRQHGLVLMDDTVILHAVQLRRENSTRAWGFKYRFDFARAGIPCKGGTVLIAPGQAPTVIIETEGGPLIEHL